MCVCVCTLKEKRLELSAPNLVHNILCGKTSTYIDPEVSRSRSQCAAGVGVHVDVTALVSSSPIHVATQQLHLLEKLNCSMLIDTVLH